MDPFVITSLGRKVMRTKVVRHNLNPVYDEKIVFQVMRHETNFSINFTVVDRDKLSGNDFVAATNFAVQKLVEAAPEADPKTGLYSLQEPPGVSPPLVKEKSRFRIPLSRSSSANSLTKLTKPTLKPKASQNSLSSQSQLDIPNGQSTYLAPTGIPADFQPPSRTNSDLEAESPLDPDLKSYIIPLDLKNKDRWEAKHSPELHVKAKYLPYRALRQQFWRAMLRQYDADESARVSKVELTTMLDTLGSTLKDSTINGFFKRFADDNVPSDTQDLTFDQAVICLEDQLQKSAQKRGTGDRLKGITHGHLSSVTNSNIQDTSKSSPKAETDVRDATNADASSTTIPAIKQDDTGKAGEEGTLLDPDDLADDEGGEEHVIEIRECPICHQPRLNKRTDADIITHIATCASQDWRQVDNLVMGGFVTSSQAQRKWYSKVITKISYGGYKLGANSANILVQDRTTGQINEERMSVYVRIGIRLLYKALGSREMEKKRSKFMFAR